MDTYNKNQNSKTMKILTFTIFLVSTSVQSCHNPVDSNIYNKDYQNAYAILFDTDDSENLYHFIFKDDALDAESTKEKIPGVYSAEDVYFSAEKQLLTVATRKALYFIDSRTHKIIKTIKIPETENPEPNYGFWEVEILPYNDHSCILVNRSIYLVNLLSKTLEYKILDALSFDRLLYLRRVKMSEDRSYLYLKNHSFGFWYEGETGFYGGRTSISKLNIVDGSIQNFREQKSILGDGYELIAPTDKYLLILKSHLSSDRTVLYRYSNTSGNLIDSSNYSWDSFFLDSFTHKNTVYLQERHSSSFYALDPETMTFEQIYSFTGDSRIGPTFFHNDKNQLNTCFYLESPSLQSVILNLSTLEILREFTISYPNKMYLKED